MSSMKSRSAPLSKYEDDARDVPRTGSRGAGLRDASRLEISRRAVSRVRGLCRGARATTSKFLSERTGVEIGCISTGPERDETILIEGSRLTQLL